MKRRVKLKKRLLNAAPVHFVLSLATSLLVRSIYFTAHVSRRYEEAALPYLRGEKPAIFCFWHGRMIMHPFVKPPGHPMFVLISHHNDGALITATMRWFGIDSVRGSRKRGSASALINLLKVTEAGGNISITPDGPRGPNQQAAAGAAYVAAKTGYPLIPITFSATRHVRFKSWDRFMLPKLFSRLVFIAAAPQTVTDDTDASIDAATATLESALNTITQEADRVCGVGR